jgi:hypothetical protein
MSRPDIFIIVCLTLSLLLGLFAMHRDTVIMAVYEARRECEKETP